MDFAHDSSIARSFTGLLSFTEGEETSVGVILSDAELRLSTGTNEIGRWSRTNVAVSRKPGDTFQMIVDGEVVWFRPNTVEEFQTAIDEWLLNTVALDHASASMEGSADEQDQPDTTTIEWLFDNAYRSESEEESVVVPHHRDEQAVADEPGLIVDGGATGSDRYRSILPTPPTGDGDALFLPGSSVPVPSHASGDTPTPGEDPVQLSDVDVEGEHVDSDFEPTQPDLGSMLEESHERPSDDVPEDEVVDLRAGEVLRDDEVSDDLVETPDAGPHSDADSLPPMDAVGVDVALEPSDPDGVPDGDLDELSDSPSIPVEPEPGPRSYGSDEETLVDEPDVPAPGTVRYEIEQADDSNGWHPLDGDEPAPGSAVDEPEEAHAQLETANRETLDGVAGDTEPESRGRYAGTAQSRFAKLVDRRRSEVHPAHDADEDSDFEEGTVADRVVEAQQAMRASARQSPIARRGVKAGLIGLGAVCTIAFLGVGVWFVLDRVSDDRPNAAARASSPSVATTVIDAATAPSVTTGQDAPVSETTISPDATVATASAPADATPDDEEVTASLGAMAVDEFIAEWDEVATPVSPILEIPVAIVPGDFEFGFTPRVSMRGSVTPDGRMEAFTIVVDPSGDASSDALALQTLGVAISVADPSSAGSDRRRILGDLGLDVSAPRLEGIDATVRENGVEYQLFYDAETQHLLFTLRSG